MTASKAPIRTMDFVVAEQPVVESTIGRGSVAEYPWIARHGLTRPGMIYRVIKRALDIVAVLLSAPVVLFLVGLAVIAVQLESPGPILHRQQRTGHRCGRFTVYKLRTMVADAEAKKAELRHLNERTWPDFKITNDPRVLRVGRILRRTGIDELPQLWNVLIGDMTLVGPRPTTLDVDAYQDWQLARFSVRPGLTGLWQVTARRDPSFVRRIRLDISYIGRRSVLLDLEILARTVVISLRGEGT